MCGRITISESSSRFLNLSSYKKDKSGVILHQKEVSCLEIHNCSIVIVFNDSTKNSFVAD